MNASALLPKQQHLDLERFQWLNADLSIFPAVARVFISVLPDWRKEMQRAIVWSDVQAVCDSLHKMKGSCSMMGAEQLALEIAQVEHALLLSDFDRSTPQLLNVLRKIGEMEDEVKVFLANA
jgi:HPt (histidine-containing phosphotransfer) domain-containing protein